jgi:hypothetical protein
MWVRLKPVALTVILRLWWVLRITARQSNSMLEPTNACEPNDVRLERRSAQQIVRHIGTSLAHLMRLSYVKSTLPALSQPHARNLLWQMSSRS